MTSKIRKNFEVVKLDQPSLVNKYVRKLYKDDISIYESAYLLMLNINNDIIGYAKLSQGGVSGTVVDYMLIAKYAVESLAKGIIIAHNHPTGRANPSKVDIIMCKNVKRTLNVFGCDLKDCIIVSPYENKYFSFKESGQL